MSDSKEQEEPSMEEILVSIRKIISEDKEEPPTGGDESAAQRLASSRALWEEPPADGDESAAEDVVEVITDASYFLRAEKEEDAEEGALELTQMVSEDGTVVDLTKTAEKKAPQ